MTLRQELSTGGGRCDLARRPRGRQAISPRPAKARRLRRAEGRTWQQPQFDSDRQGAAAQRPLLRDGDDDAVHLATNGNVHDLDTTRRLDNVVVNLDYDAKALWDILRPMMDPRPAASRSKSSR